MRYRFEGYCLDLPRRMLTGPEGAIALRPKVFDLLAHLLANRDKVVTKDALFEALWPGVHVGDASLNSAIKAARQAVGDDGQTQRVIKTWHGHGYRFVADVDIDGEASAPADPEPAVDRPPETADAVDMPKPAPPPFATGKEHKQVTVLDCCIDDLGELAQMLDAEALDDVMERFRAVANRTIERHGGCIAERSSTGFVALFGAPVADEDHARRAVSAAVALMAALADAFTGEDQAVSFRVGLHSGPVVVGAVAGAPDQLVTAAGPTMMTARTLQAGAPAGRPVISPATYAIVGSDVICEVDGAGPAGDPAATRYLVTAMTATRAGVPRRQARRLSRYVGRERELDFLHDRLTRVAHEGGQAVGVTGEPGIGKSRLIEEFQQRASTAAARFIGANCLSFTQASPFFVLSRLLQQICGSVPLGSPARQQAQLSDRLRAVGRDTPVLNTLLGRIIGLTVDDAAVATMTPEERRAEIFSTLCALVAQLADNRPCVIVVEDLHWIDPSSNGWLNELGLRLAGMKVLLLGTYRPGYEADWLQRATAAQVKLPPLLAADSTRLVRSGASAEDLSADAISSIVAKGQGNPFFLEELAWSAADHDGVDNTIPQSVQSVLAARIDRLDPTAKALLQVASVIGRDAPISLIESIDGLSDADRKAGLTTLQQAEFLFERLGQRDPVLAFKHALTQEVAYGSLLARTRRALHGRIAEVLIREHPALVAERPELLASHLAASGDEDGAVDYWTRAGDEAVQRSADAEAVTHYTAALAALAKRPHSRARDELELGILLKLGVSLLMVRGPGSDELGHTYQRAHEIGAEIATERQRFETIWGLWVCNSHRAHPKKALVQASDLITIAEASGDPELRLQAHHAMWTTDQYIGGLEQVNAHVAAAIEIQLVGPKFLPSTLVGGHDPIVCGHGTRARVFWLQGHQALSDAEIARAISLAESLNHIATLTNALHKAIDLALVSRNVTALTAHAARLKALAVEQRFARSLTIAEFAEAWCAFQSGERAQSLEDMNAALTTLAGSGERTRRAYMVQLMAEAYATCGHYQRALALLGTIVDETEAGAAGYWAEAEAHRQWAQILLASASENAGKAEVRLRHAMKVAERQGARMWQLRAATDLAELLRSRGEPSQADALLAPLHRYFTDGLRTADPQIRRGAR